MNIFVLSKIIKLCAQYHCDKHVVKMILESAQMLCTAHRVLDQVNTVDGVRIYKIFGKKHPCNLWTQASSENYSWLYNLFIELCNEYTYRYGKTHICDTKFRNALEYLPVNIPTGELTPFAVAMPDQYKIKNEDGTYDAIKSYRAYYNGAKRDFCVWTKRDVPKWFLNS